MMILQRLMSMCSCQISIGVFCIFLILYLFVKIIALITGFHIIGVMILIFLFYLLLRRIGQFAIYPGSFSYIRSEVQINASKRMADQTFKNMDAFFHYLQNCAQLNFIENVPPIYSFLEEHIRFFSKFQGSLAPPKQQILNNYRSLEEYLNSQISSFESKKITVKELVHNPIKIRQLVNNTETYRSIISEIMQKSSKICLQINHLIRSYEPPANDFTKSVMYNLYGQKLFQLRFAYHQWDKKFVYDLHQIQTRDKNQIQCAIIKGLKEEGLENMQKTKRDNQAVLLSCPNGAFIQFYAFDCRHVFFYLQMGYQIILWNYRGYGASTGSPSIAASIDDAQTVYQYCKEQLGLETQITHGYSVGGPPSIHLTAKYPEQIKLLIVDRSFSQIRYVARSLSPVLQYLYKLVFWKDDQINNSNSFLSAKNCLKLIIWDENDEVIADKCSLKKEVMLNMFEEKYGTYKKFKSGKHNKYLGGNQKVGDFQGESALTQELNPTNQDSKKSSTQIQFDDSQDQIDVSIRNGTKTVAQIIQSIQHEIFEIFIESMGICIDEESQKQSNKVFHLPSKLDNQSQLQEMVNCEKISEERQGLEQRQKRSQNQNTGKMQNILRQLFEVTDNIDGGGIFIFNIQLLKQLLRVYQLEDSDSQEVLMSLQEKISTYVLSLVIYGSYYNPDSRNVKQQSCFSLRSARVHAINQLQKILLLLAEKKFEKEIILIVKKLKKVFSKIKSLLDFLVNDSQSDQLFLGILLPTKVGHNGQLQQREYDIIQKIIETKLQSHE